MHAVGAVITYQIRVIGRQKYSSSAMNGYRDVQDEHVTNLAPF